SLVSRRDFIGLSLGTAASVLGAGMLGQMAQAQDHSDMPHQDGETPATSMHSGHMAALVGAVNHEANGFDPMQLLVDWDMGSVIGTNDVGKPVREYNISSGDIEIEIAPGIFFPAWAFNGRVPGPSIRCTEGDSLKINFS